MKKLSLCLILACSFSWISLKAESMPDPKLQNIDLLQDYEGRYGDEYLDALLDDYDATLKMLRARAKAYSKKSHRMFDPEEMNLIGALSRREYERSIIDNPITWEDAEKFSPPEGGHVEWNSLLLAHRYEGVFQNTHRRMRAVYGNKILKEPIRVINNVGGIFATMEVLSCSMREYVAIFGTLLDQEGYSGRYKHMNVWDIMVDGVMISHSIKRSQKSPVKENAGQTTLPITYGPAEVSFLKKKERRLYRMLPGAMMIDYGRGFIPPAFFQGVILPFSNNADFPSMNHQLGQCVKSITQRWFHKEEESDNLKN